MDSGLERRGILLDLNEAGVEAPVVFLFSTYTVALTLDLVIILLLIIPGTRRGLRRLIPVEVSFEPEAEDFAAQYYSFLSSTRLNVEEAFEVKAGEVRIIVPGSNIVPRVKDVDHAVFLVSDGSFIPPRREVRLLKEMVDLKPGLEALSRLVKTYSENVGVRVVGVLVCKEVKEEMLNSLKGLDVEVVFLSRSSLRV